MNVEQVAEDNEPQHNIEEMEFVAQSSVSVSELNEDEESDLKVDQSL